MMPKTLVIVQCRYGSTRLRGKALFPLCGLPLLSFLLKRLQEGLPTDQYMIMLATTERQDDDVIESWGMENHIEVVRGETENVLRRYIQCLQRYSADSIVRVTADNPLTCPEILKTCVNELQQYHADYVQSQETPYGAGVDVFRSEIVRMMDEEAREQYEREHINAFVLKHPERFTIRFSQAQKAVARPDLRVSVDTKQDWENVKAIFTPDEKTPWRIPLEEVIIRMDSSATS